MFNSYLKTVPIQHALNHLKLLFKSTLSDKFYLEAVESQHRFTSVPLDDIWKYLKIIAGWKFKNLVQKIKQLRKVI
jgi:hypothetical protein